MKAKEKKLNKKAKHLEERENRLRLVKKDINKNEVIAKVEISDGTDATSNVNLTSLQHSLKSEPNLLLTMASYSYKYMSNNTTFPSMVSHILPLPSEFTDKRKCKRG